MMPVITNNLNERATEEAFSRQSLIFDNIYAGNTIVSYKRERVRSHVLCYLKPGSKILELNSGTGEDATFFAGEGYFVHATDISAGMQQQLLKKSHLYGLDQRISTELCSYTDLNSLKNRGPYDLIFSNFAGLNCTDKLDNVLLSLSPLLKTGGIVTLVLLPKFCLWETLLLFKGKFKTAFRRFSTNGAKAHIEGTYFKCYYYSPGFVSKTLRHSFDVLKVEGLCTLVPPSYIEGFAETRPKTYNVLKRLENKLKEKWPWKMIGDYYIITVQKR